MTDQTIDNQIIEKKTINQHAAEVKTDNSSHHDALKEKLSKLTTDQRAALLKRLQQPEGDVPFLDNQAAPFKTTPFKTTPEHRFAPFALTDVQEAYWVGRQQGFDLGEVAAHGYMEIDCHELDTQRFNHAWNTLINRHDMLRCLVRSNGEQCILEAVPDYTIPLEDLNNTDNESRDSNLQKTREEMSHQVFNTEKWPLFDFRFSKIDSHTTRLHVSLDVLILDAWSLDLLSNELETLYHNPDKPLPELELTFRDYIAHQHQNTALVERAKNYWLKRLPQLPNAPDLPISNLKGTDSKPIFRRKSRRLEAKQWHQFKSHCSQNGVTPSLALLAAYAAVLANWSSSAHFTLNLTLFNRQPVHEQINDIVGDFTSVILLEVNFNHDLPFFENVKNLQHQLWRDMDHRQFSGIQCVRELTKMGGNTPATSMPVVFTSAIGQSDNALPFTWAGNEVFTITQTPQVWLDNQIAEDRGCLVYDWDFVEQIFPEYVVEDMFSAYSQLLRTLATDASHWKSTQFSLTPDKDIACIQVANQTQKPLPQGLLFESFCQQAEKQPDAPAIICDQRTLTYKTLENHSNQLGHFLQSKYIQPNDLVAIIMEKGWQQIVAAIGIQKAGGAYVPIAPNLPKERLWKLLEQTEASIVLSTNTVMEKLSLPAWVNAFDIESHPILEQNQTPCICPAQPNDLAYVIFTSGSTGLPKGVMIDHRGALNTVIDINKRLSINSTDRILALSSLNFDLSVYDIFGTLAAGAALVVPREEARLEFAYWQTLFIDHGITVWNSVPTLFDLLVSNIDESNAHHFNCLRHVMLSGDWIPTDLPTRSQKYLNEVKILSLGGATEASIWSIYYPIDHVSSAWKSIPYGKALDNQSMQVLNNQGKICPTWVTGEICIGGVGLAVGYWRDKQKTDHAFFTNPHTQERLYRTGDLGRLLPDGNIEILGRKDFQVKVQGHRIELGEIEAALVSHSSIAKTLVTTTEDLKGVKRLVAYVVPQKLSLAHTVDENGVIIDATQRFEFKLAEHNIRSDLSKSHVVALERPEPTEDVIAHYLKHRSYRHFDSTRLKHEQLGQLLSVLSAIDYNNAPKYLYGSAGGLYPVQSYLYVKPNRIDAIEAGIYYYHPREHQLIPVNLSERIETVVHDAYNHPAFEQSAFTLFFIADLKAIQPLYGHHALDFCKLEAGLMCQAIENEAIQQDIGMCQIGAFEFEKIREKFSLHEDHIYLHSLLGGPIDHKPQQSRIQKQQSPANLEEKLKIHLLEKLPQYMVPSYFVSLDAFPVNANGKIDRNALPKPEQCSKASTTPYTAPSSDIENIIASIWKDVLHVEQVGIEDSFFDLGGNSVHMVQVHNQLKAQLPIDLNLVEMFFNYPNIRSLAKKLSGDNSQTIVASELGRSSGEKRRNARKQRQTRTSRRSN